MLNSWILKKLPVFLLLTVSIVVLGCTHKFQPKLMPMEQGMVGSFTSNNKISIVNAQTSKADVFIGKYLIHKYVADLNEWTDRAIKVLTIELDKNNIGIEEGSIKVLKISVTKSRVIFGQWAIRCIINLHVETGDGYKADFEGNAASPATIYRAEGGAVTRAVGAMLNDENIINYIKN